jgi:Polymorphic toxin system, DSP-PTPase phosphatase
VTLRSGPYPEPSQLADGTTLFVDLTEEGSLDPYAQLLPEGVRHVRMAIPDFGVPTEQEMIAILDLIDAALSDGEEVYVHCRMGIGRTRTVIGCHRRRHGLDPGPPPETREQRELVRGWPEGR